MRSSQLMARQLNDKNKKTEEKRQALLDFIARFSANASKVQTGNLKKKSTGEINDRRNRTELTESIPGSFLTRNVKWEIKY